jgi:hypothetical protein
VEVTVEWHSDGRRFAAPRRVLTLGAAVLIAAVGAIVIAQEPSSRSATPTTALTFRCQHSGTPRMFVGDSHPKIPAPVHVPGCP